MKTKQTKRSEALKRREADLATLVAIEKLHGELTLVGYDDYLAYGKYVIFVTGAMPSNDAITNDYRSKRLEYEPQNVVLDADGFFARKKAAAIRDIENLKKKLEGYHG